MAVGEGGGAFGDGCVVVGEGGGFPSTEGLDCVVETLLPVVAKQPPPVQSGRGCLLMPGGEKRLDLRDFFVLGESRRLCVAEGIGRLGVGMQDVFLQHLVHDNARARKLNGGRVHFCVHRLTAAIGAGNLNLCGIGGMSHLSLVGMWGENWRGACHVMFGCGRGRKRGREMRGVWGRMGHETVRASKV
jgi:hypothetical protein